MSEIVVGDVVSWEPELEWSGTDADLQRALSWAVTIRATIPALPPLRGGELILAPWRVLDELQQNEMVGWREIAYWLATERIAGLVVEHDFTGVPVAEVPLLRATPGFLADAEPYLNRIITEHRAALYHLGSDLSRALSTASISGADLNALVTIAGDVGGQDLVLFDRSGTVVGRSRNGPRSVPFHPDQVRYANGMPAVINTNNGLWLAQRTSFADGDDLFLAAGSGARSTPETVRLVLSQTLTAIEAFVCPLGNRRQIDAAPARESILADLLSGRIPSGQMTARAASLEIDPAEALSVALFVSPQPGFESHIRASLGKVARARSALVSPTELAILVPKGDRADWWGPLEVVARENPSVVLVRSEQQPDLSRVAYALRQARVLGRLRLAGESGAGRVADVLLPLWDPLSFEPGPERLNAFADQLLGPLETHDRERSGDLIDTLQSYLAAGGSSTGAAELLDVHRNTLGYRLKRIGELTGRDPDDADTRLAYGLAFKIRALSRILD